MVVAPERALPASLTGQTVTFKQCPTPTAEIVVGRKSAVVGRKSAVVGRKSAVAREEEKCKE